MMQIERTAIDGVLIIRPQKFEDSRGYFAPVLRTADLEAAGVTHGWAQENQSLSLRKGTIRGLHFQRPPFAQAKLIRVSRGSALDVCVDIRKGSPTWGKHVSTLLSADNLVLVYVSVGFAHGLCTLTDDTVVNYRVSAEWSPSHESGIQWNDPALGIDWPVSYSDAILSDRDRAWPLFGKSCLAQ